jgi:HSP20 family molecular chaperone IbpA
MSTHILEQNVHPFDLLFRNFFEPDRNFFPVVESKIPHPVDIYESDFGLHFEIACTGLTKADVLRISYTKEKNETDNGYKYIHRGVAKRSFNLGYKISSKFNLTKAAAEMNNGLLEISIPFAQEAKPRSLKIN